MPTTASVVMPLNVNRPIPLAEREVCMTLLKMFQIEGQPADTMAAEGQIAIFHAIVFRPHWMMEILCSTQYGKSLFVALALVVVSCVQDELCCVVAPSDEKAKIIMRYYIEHLGDNPMFYKQLEKNTRLERLRMEDSKERIVLKKGGGVYVLSANAKNAKKGIEAAIGAGARVVIADESSLLPDDIEATIFRMIAGKKDPFYCKIGNPFYRNHFLRSWMNPNVWKIFIDYQQALKEGRYVQEFIEEARKKPFFDVLYACMFPAEDRIDEQGYMRLITDDQLTNAMQEAESFGERRLGNDIAEGGTDANALVLRSANYATAAIPGAIEWHGEDTMDTAAKDVAAAEEHGVDDRNIFIDSIGIGKGVYDRLVEHKYEPVSAKFSEAADDDAMYDDVQFLNKRSECYWGAREWIISGGKLDPVYSDQWMVFQSIKYRIDMNGKIQIKGKRQMRKEGLPSPNVPDALALTFFRKTILKKLPPTQKEKLIVREFDANRRRQGGPGGAYFTGSRYLSGQ